MGEVRSSECATFTAMNTGHDGSFGSLHANTAMETITRMINPPMNVPPIMLTGLDLIIIQARLYVNGKTARKITEVAEVAGMKAISLIECNLEETLQQIGLKKQEFLPR